MTAAGTLTIWFTSLADQNVSIQPGQVATLSVRLDAGATIQNQDETAAVWVSAAPFVSPGTGTRVGPKGSIQWTTGGAPCYAVPDTGVTKPVSLTVSSDVAMPVNPIDIGTAVATQLLAKGVPNVLLGEEIPYVNLGTPIDVSRYASLTVRVFVASPCVLFYEYLTDKAGWTVIGSRSFVMAEAGYLTFTTDVKGPWFILGTNLSNQASNALFYGTNRTLGDKVLSTDTALHAAPNIAWTNGQNTPIANSTFVTNGGMHTIRMGVTNNGRGFLTYKSASASGSIVDGIGIHTGLGVASPNPVTPGIVEVLQNVIFPPGVLTFSFLSYVTGTFQVVLQVTPTT